MRWDPADASACFSPVGATPLPKIPPPKQCATGVCVVVQQTPWRVWRVWVRLMCFCSKLPQRQVYHRPLCINLKYPPDPYHPHPASPPPPNPPTPPTFTLPLSPPGSTSVVGVHGTIISQSLSDVVYDMRLFVCACVCICFYVKNAYTKTGMLPLTRLRCIFMDIL